MNFYFFRLLKTVLLLLTLDGFLTPKTESATTPTPAPAAATSPAPTPTPTAATPPTSAPTTKAPPAATPANTKASTPAPAAATPPTPTPEPASQPQAKAPAEPKEPENEAMASRIESATEKALRAIETYSKEQAAALTQVIAYSKEELFHRGHVAISQAAGPLGEKLQAQAKAIQSLTNFAEYHKDTAAAASTDAKTAALRAEKALEILKDIVKQAEADRELKFATELTKMLEAIQAARTDLIDEISEKNYARQLALAKEIEAQKHLLEREREPERLAAKIREAEALAEVEVKKQKELEEANTRTAVAAAKAAQILANETNQRIARTARKAEEKRYAADRNADSKKHQETLAANKEFYNSIFDGLNNFSEDNTKLIKILGGFVGTIALYYTAKHGIPYVIETFKQPSLVSETSKTSLFGWKKPSKHATLEELTFNHELEKQLHDIAAHLKTAQQFNENLPNILFSGPSGVGKTAVAKAFACMKDERGNTLFEYALTSGSEFAKIKDLNLATNELRKLILWAQKSKKPIIVFIDEAESLFANRGLPSTPKSATDFINAFLTMVQDKSQKNICFIFATNHPFKLDDAILNRIGKKIDFTLPHAEELKKILVNYVTTFASSNANAMVSLSPEVGANIDAYAQRSLGCAPRDVKFVAEQMIQKARRNKPALCTHAIALETLEEARHELTTTAQWEKERATWMRLQEACRDLVLHWEWEK